MPTKDGRQQQEPALHPYEAVRLKQCMQNNARLRQLGLDPIPSSILTTQAAIISNSNKPKDRNGEGSDSEYDPEQDETGEANLSDENTDKDSMASKKSTKTTTKKPRPAKRVLAQQQTTRVTRSKKSLTVQDDASIELSQAEHFTATTEAEEIAPNLTNLSVTDEQGAQGLSRMANNEGNGSAEPAIVNHISQQDGETQLDVVCEGGRKREINMGKGLQKMSRSRRGKLPVIIPEGRIRPVVPLIAAKFATECNIAVRNHVPVLKHWKEYKKHPGMFKQFVGKLSAKFDMDTSATVVQKACSQMMKNALRQQRYRLKKKYFDPYPLHLVSKTSPVKSMTDEQWNELVEFWKDPIKMAICEKNKANRGQVKFHQTTGSRSYMVHCENLGDKYNDEDPNAFDLFKECHYSNKKKGYSPAIQLAIHEMENKISEAVDVDQEPRSVSEVVAAVLAEHTKKSKFLQNVGIESVQPRSSVVNLEQDLAAEKRANAELCLVVDTQREQIDVLSEQLREAEEARVRDKEEMQKRQAETDAKLDFLLSQVQPSRAKE